MTDYKQLLNVLVAYVLLALLKLVLIAYSQRNRHDKRKR